MSDGKGCNCEARDSSECGCDADWTPQEVYDLRARVKEKDVRIAALEAENEENRKVIQVAANKLEIMGKSRDELEADKARLEGEVKRQDEHKVWLIAQLKEKDKKIELSKKFFDRHKEFVALQAQLQQYKDVMGKVREVLSKHALYLEELTPDVASDALDLLNSLEKSDE